MGMGQQEGGVRSAQSGACTWKGTCKTGLYLREQHVRDSEAASLVPHVLHIPSSFCSAATHLFKVYTVGGDGGRTEWIPYL
ncbi:hypothetical protein L1987_34419 [Smallanthus sonchifolius]|uniref:Uncharacterized protein n=1 Tax=Smallanthus sonchifolius TaxID=185202 RepID=A0ACB9HTT5_9ASTR|nr:hypothetical protein L1987_34419 [Smallanthus sonchifolius]